MAFECHDCKCHQQSQTIQDTIKPSCLSEYAIIGFIVPLDTLWVILETILRVR